MTPEEEHFELMVRLFNTSVAQAVRDGEKEQHAQLSALLTLISDAHYFLKELMHQVSNIKLTMNGEKNEQHLN